MDLLQEIDKVILSEKRETRNYIGASSIGSECPRKLWYRFNGYPEEFDADSLRRFADGHAVEERILNWLRAIPNIKLWTHDENGEQYGFSALDGKYQGHYDGVIEIDGVLYVLEIKATTKQSGLIKSCKDYPEEYALEQWNPEYYAQAMTYCKFADIPNHLLICSDAGGRNLFMVRTPYNANYADALLLKAERIANAKEPPNKVGGKNFWKCKMCSFYGICYES
jgi:CRISPR/Cas system-associated exonuclease Cas4 (RecB family)